MAIPRSPISSMMHGARRLGVGGCEGERPCAAHQFDCSVSGHRKSGRQAATNGWLSVHVKECGRSMVSAVQNRVVGRLPWRLCQARRTHLLRTEKQKKRKTVSSVLVRFGAQSAAHAERPQPQQVVALRLDSTWRRGRNSHATGGLERAVCPKTKAGVWVAGGGTADPPQPGCEFTCGSACCHLRAQSTILREQSLRPCAPHQHRRHGGI